MESMNNTTSKTKGNERSWAIDIISKINFIVQRYEDSPIQKAGGEMSLRVDNKVLFPDVLLFGDANKTKIVQGWELKLPDTPIDDKEFFLNAKSKALSMDTNSFLLWNGSEAKLFIREEKEYILYKHWDNCQHIKSREDMTLYETDLDNFLEQIIYDLNYYFRNNVLYTSSILKSIVNENIINIAFKNLKNCASSMKSHATINVSFRDNVDNWWYEEKSSYKDSSDKWIELSKTAIVSLINKFIFTNLLKKFYSEAQKINDIHRMTSIHEILSIFKEISDECDFYNILEEKMGERFIDKDTFEILIEFNTYLIELDFNKFSNILLEDLLHQVVARSKRKGAGQFTTPREVSLLLSSLTIGDATTRVLDPCCGTGTIARAMYDYKRFLGVSSEEAISQVWASDKFQYPLQFAMLSLSSPENIGKQINIFQKDIFLIHPNKTVTLHKPYSNEKEEVKAGSFGVILSNLPFIKSKTYRDNNPDMVPIIDKLNFGFSKRSDIYVPITMKLNELLESNGRVGLVLSNSWLGSDFGHEFFNSLQKNYRVLYIVNSGKGRWFKETKVVATLLILEKKSTINNNMEKTKFIKINDYLSKLIPNTEESIRSANDLARRIRTEVVSNDFQVESYSNVEIDQYAQLGLLKNALFTDCSWLLRISEKLEPITKFFTVGRGIREGANEFFYPKNHNIEKQYIKPVLKAVDNSGLNIHKNDWVDGFFCNKSIDELKTLGHHGALEWIDYYTKNRTAKGQYLPDRKVKKGYHWYQMSDGKLYDIVTAINPYQRFFFSKGEELFMSDQRLTGFTFKKNLQSLDLHFALMNSIVSLFYIEAIGFGRGDGVLDLSKDRVNNNLHMLNPDLLEDTQKQKILDTFKVMEKRKILPLAQELEMADRIAFDKVVLHCFGLEGEYKSIKDSLLDLYSMRLSVKN